jgi:plasmid maintenance system antidote protein VapI
LHSFSASPASIYDILRERKPVSAAVAVRLGKLFGEGAGVWVRMQAAYDTWNAERKEDVMSRSSTTIRTIATPNRVTAHPGEVLKEEFLKPLGMSINALAIALRVPPGHARSHKSSHGKRRSNRAGCAAPRCLIALSAQPGAVTAVLVENSTGRRSMATGALMIKLGSLSNRVSLVKILLALLINAFDFYWPRGMGGRGG